MEIKKISEKTWELIKELSRPKRAKWFFLKETVSKESVLSLLDQIFAAEEPAILPEMFLWAFSADEEIGQRAAKKIHGMVKKFSGNELLSLDKYFRQRSVYLPEPPIQWYHLEPKDLERLFKFKEEKISLFGLSSFHPNGYLREKGLIYLGREDSPKVLPFLLIRLNDWVPEIRRTADELLRYRLNPSLISDFVDQVEIVDSLKKCRRKDDSSFFEVFFKTLNCPEGIKALFAKFEDSNARVRRGSFKLGLEITSILPDVEKKCLSSKDPVIRSWGFQSIPPSGFDLATLESLTRDSFVPIRRKAIRLLAKSFPEKYEGIYEKALFDRSKSIREDALYNLNKIGVKDVSGKYRIHIVKNILNSELPAILGLGETGEQADCELLIQFAKDFRARVRKVALFSISKLNFSKHEKLFWTALVDRLPSISRTAARILSQKRGVLQAVILLKIFSTVELEHVRKNVLKLVLFLSKWEKLEALLTLLNSDEEKFKVTAKEGIRLWMLGFNKESRELSETQRHRIDKLLANPSNKVGKGDLEKILFFLPPPKKP
ncbi:hypothetical protein HYY75_06330 [bacterium]|nr:hypothetical protein [bacterium]